jgi:hypothetical protein
MSFSRRRYPRVMRRRSQRNTKEGFRIASVKYTYELDISNNPEPRY